MTIDPVNRFKAPPDIVVQSGVRIAVDDGLIPASFGRGCIIRSGTTIYGDVTAGDHLRTGHNVLIRERTKIGNHVTIGTQSVIEGDCVIGDCVTIQSLCFIPTHVTIGSRVFLGPRVTFTNDRYPLRARAGYRPDGAIVEDDVTIGAAAVILPGVTIGRGSFVAAGAVVTKNVPPMHLAIGLPARMRTLPEKLRETNRSPSWEQPDDGG